LTLPK